MRYILKCFRRRPLLAVAVILFSAIIAFALCGLHNANVKAQAHFDEIYHTIEVRCTITNLSGTRSDGLDIYPTSIHRFTGTGTTDPKDTKNVADLVKDVQIKGSRQFIWNDEKYTLVGITSPQIAPSLQPENGCTVFYYEGADESFFRFDGMQCIIPEAMLKKLQKLELPEDALDIHIDVSRRTETPFDGQLQIVGTYRNQDEKIIYCSWATYRGIIRSMSGRVLADAMFATLVNNDDVDLLRQETRRWFATPDPANAGKQTIGNFYLGLDINDSQLRQAEETLETSLTINRAAAILVFVLSAGAGAFVGFLMIRSRKRDIALMRTMGTSNARIGFSFAIEQMICVALGAIVGGAGFFWTPIRWLALFAGIYCVGLTVALLIFLRNNLLTTIKEDE